MILFSDIIYFFYFLFLLNIFSFLFSISLYVGFVRCYMMYFYFLCIINMMFYDVFFIFPFIFFLCFYVNCFIYIFSPFYFTLVCFILFFLYSTRYIWCSAIYVIFMIYYCLFTLYSWDVPRCVLGCSRNINGVFDDVSLIIHIDSWDVLWYILCICDVSSVFVLATSYTKTFDLP